MTEIKKRTTEFSAEELVKAIWILWMWRDREWTEEQEKEFYEDLKKVFENMHSERIEEIMKSAKQLAIDGKITGYYINALFQKAFKEARHKCPPDVSQDLVKLHLIRENIDSISSIINDIQNKLFDLDYSDALCKEYDNAFCCDEKDLEIFKLNCGRLEEILSKIL